MLLSAVPLLLVCLTNTEDLLLVRSADENRGKKPKKEKNVMHPPHLMIGNLPYIFAFRFNTSLMHLLH